MNKDNLDPLDSEKTIPGAGQDKRAELSAGTMLGRYRIIKLLGRGGMGQVYLVQHELQKTTHALKILPSEFSSRSGFVERFRTELQTMARLQHENIVHVTHSDEQDGLYYLVMDFIAADGADEPYDLEEALAEHKQFDPETVRALMLQICNGLAYAHSHGVVHRDLKPANILLTQKITEVGGRQSEVSQSSSTINRQLATGGLTAKITDFGLAKVAGEEQLRTMVAQSIQRSMSLGDESTFVEKKRSERSSTGSVLGTYGYMSPEQEEGRPADERSDIYSLGVMMYRMITGQRLRGMAKSPSKIVPGLDPAWDGIIETCLEPNPEERFQSAEELKAALAGERFKPRKTRTTRKEKSPQKGAKKAVIGMLVAGVLGVGGYLSYTSYESHQAAKAEAVRLEQERQAEKTRMAQLAAEQQKKLAGLLNEAQGLFARSDFDAAGRKANEALGLDSTNSAARDLLARIQSKVGEQQASTAKVDAKLARERAASVPDCKLKQEMERQWQIGETAWGRERWQDAWKAYQETIRLAGLVQQMPAYFAAKQEWNRRISNNEQGVSKEELRQYAAAEWTQAVTLAKEAEGLEENPALGKEKYEAALVVYQQAVKKTVPFLVPKLQISVIPAGADLKISNIEQGMLNAEGTILEKGKSYTLTVSKKGYKKHTETLTADWTGLEEKRVVLEEYKGPEEGKDWISPVTGMEFVWIRQMGMWVGKYEVTNGEYRRKEPGHDSKSYNNHSLNHDRQPVLYVNFDDATAYAKWLTERDRASGNLPAGFEYRLPTGDEWMRFAQCGDGRTYPWGNEWPPPSGRAGNYSGQESAWLNKISGYRDDFPVTCKVEQSWANPWGLYGVGGNVWECTTKMPNGLFDAWRGASWFNDFQDYLRCSLRVDNDASSQSCLTGFRLVLPLPEQN